MAGFREVMKFVPLVGQIFELGFVIRDKVQAGRRERAEIRAIEQCKLNDDLKKRVLDKAEARKAKP